MNKTKKTKKELELECEFLRLQLQGIYKIVSDDDVFDNYAQAFGRVRAMSNMDEVDKCFRFIIDYDEPIDFFCK